MINDQTSGAGVLLESTRLRGVLRGNALGQPQIINMLPDERVKPGERVITSGGDQIFPRGLPVGVVDQVVPDTSNPPYIDIVIKPAANLGHLEELLVITEASDRMPPTAQQDLAQSAAEGAAVEQAAGVGYPRRATAGSERSQCAGRPWPGPETSYPGHHGSRRHCIRPRLCIPIITARIRRRRPMRSTPGQAVVDPKYAPQPKAPRSRLRPSRQPTVRPRRARFPSRMATRPHQNRGNQRKPELPSSLSILQPALQRRARRPYPGRAHPPVAKPKPPKVTEPAAPPEPPADGGQPQ